MKAKILGSFENARGRFKKGDEVDLPQLDIQPLIDTGLAEPLEKVPYSGPQLDDVVKAIQEVDAIVANDETEYSNYFTTGGKYLLDKLRDMTGYGNLSGFDREKALEFVHAEKIEGPDNG